MLALTVTDRCTTSFRAQCFDYFVCKSFERAVDSASVSYIHTAYKTKGGFPLNSHRPKAPAFDKSR